MGHPITKLAKRTNWQGLITLGPALFIWAVMNCASLFKGLPDILRGNMPGNDDYMRMVQIRDWINGAGWTELTQYRLFPPDPLYSHWARLSDILVAIPIKLLTPIFGAQNAEIIAICLVPILLSLVMLILVVKIAQQLTDNPWIALTSGMMSVLCAPIYTQFQLGRVDHHGLQIVIGLLVAYSLIKSASRPRMAILTGLASATALWVGIEGAPFIAAACLAMGLVWVLEDEHAAKRTRYFAGSFFLASAALFLTTRPVSLWGAAHCDALSPVYVLLAGAIATSFMICSFVKSASPLRRFLILGSLGLGSMALTLVVFPHCSGGPYAELDPRLTAVWLDNVSEAKGFIRYVADDYALAASLLSIPIAALITLALVSYNRGFGDGIWRNSALRSLIIFMSVCMLVSLIQIRGIILAGAFASPIAAWLMAKALLWSEVITNDVKRALTRASIIFGLSPLLAPLIITLAMGKTGTLRSNVAPATEVASTSAPDLPRSTLIAASEDFECRNKDNLRALSQLPKGFAISQIDLGAAILYHTDHLSVSAAPYHRNEAGNNATLDVFMEDESSAKQTAIDIKADYIIACYPFAETGLITAMAPHGLLSDLVKNNVPDWLEPIELDQNKHLLAYRVLAK